MNISLSRPVRLSAPTTKLACMSCSASFGRRIVAKLSRVVLPGVVFRSITAPVIYFVLSEELRTGPRSIRSYASRDMKKHQGAAPSAYSCLGSFMIFPPKTCTLNTAFAILGCEPGQLEYIITKTGLPAVKLLHCFVEIWEELAQR